MRVVLRAFALLQLAKGVSALRMAGIVPPPTQAIRKVGHRYQEGGLAATLSTTAMKCACSLQLPLNY